MVRVGKMEKSADNWSLANELKILGEQGWELATFFEDPARFDDYVRLVLKRPIDGHEPSV